MTEQPARPTTLVVAAILVLLSGVAFVVTGVAVLASRTSTFSIGVAVMLALYGVLVLLVGWGAWRARSWAWGALIACSLLHLAVLLSLAGSSPSPWAFRGLAVVALAGAVCGAMPATRRAMGR